VLSIFWVLDSQQQLLERNEQNAHGQGEAVREMHFLFLTGRAGQEKARETKRVQGPEEACGLRPPVLRSTRNSNFYCRVAAVDASKCQTMTQRAIVQIAFGVLLFLWVPMGCVCSNQTQLKNPSPPPAYNLSAILCPY